MYRKWYKLWVPREIRIRKIIFCSSPALSTSLFGGLGKRKFICASRVQQIGLLASWKCSGMVVHHLASPYQIHDAQFITRYRVTHHNFGMDLK